MKKFLTFVITAVILALSLGLVACVDDQGKFYAPEKGSDIAWSTEEKTNYIEAVDYTEFVEPFTSGEQLSAFERKAADKQVSTEASVYRSIYFDTYINGGTSPVSGYTMATNLSENSDGYTGPHTVVFLDVSEDVFENGGKIQIRVAANANTFNSVTSAQIYPERLNVPNVINGHDITFEISGYNTYTLILNGSYTYPYTLIVRRPEKVEVPYGYTVIEYERGVHFVDGNTFHNALNSRTILYLHAGAVVVPDWNADFTAEPDGSGGFIFNSKQISDVKIVGHGLIDMSRLKWHACNGIKLSNITNLEINGITIVNSPNWSLMLYGCKNAVIEDCAVFGYRTNSDGFCIASSEDVTVKNCFARSGDDLFEVKTYAGKANNILFENCIAWADKCRGFGIIQETVSDISNVKYKNCSLLYQLGNWIGNTGYGFTTSDTYMAGFVIAAGHSGNISNITFDGCDINYCLAYAMNFSVGGNEENKNDFNNTITNVLFKDCSVKNAGKLYGWVRCYNNTTDPNAISGLVFDNFYMDGVGVISTRNQITDHLQPWSGKLTNAEVANGFYWGIEVK